MVSSSLRRVLVVASLLLASSFLALAQQADIVGTVTDPAGAVIPNAKVTITSIERGQAREVTSNDAGQYAAPSLSIGHYKIRVEVAGFKKSEQEVVLNVGDRLRVDMKLEVGNATESVTVEAEAVAVKSESGEISDVITGQQVTQLATNGRSMYSLATLTAGASADMSDLNVPTSAGGNATVSFNGLRQNHNLWLLDGGEAADRGGAGGMSVMPSVDAIAEFRTMTSNYSSEYGLSSGATMTMAIKSGTKDFHASAWEFVRNDALDANNFFFNAAGNKPPKLRFNTYGFNVGGPVTLGKLYNKDREKTFFFYNMEWRKLVTGGVLNQTVPLASEYGGQFPSSTIIRAPTTDQIAPSVQNQLTSAGASPGAPFPGNKIPASLISPVAVALLQAGIFSTLR